MTNETLLKFIPNYIAPGYNEKYLLDKIQPLVDIAESWADIYVCPSKIVKDSQLLSEMHDNCVALRAIRLAAPLLNVTMHPNGLAVVSTDALTPASAERSLEFSKALERQLLFAADKFVDEITGYSLTPSEQSNHKSEYTIWINSVPAQTVWLATVFQSSHQMIAYCGFDESWNSFINAIYRIRQYQEHFAEHWLSPELMNVLSLKKYPGDLALWPVFSNVLNLVRSAAAATLNKENSKADEMLRQAVNIIRKNPDTFPEWHNSSTARLFNPEHFKNNKKAGGFFF